MKLTCTLRILSILLLGETSVVSAACEVYRIGIDTSRMSGVNGRLGLELVNSGHLFGESDDYVEIIEYEHDAVFDGSDTFGGWEQAGGQMADPDCPCQGYSWIYSDRGFHNGFYVDYSMLGNYINFHVNFVDANDASTHPSQFSAFFTGWDYFPNVNTEDPLGANALFTITSGSLCEELTVFAPAVFVPPDSIFIDFANVTSVGRDLTGHQLSLLRVNPNPVRGTVRLDFVASAGAVDFKVFDIQGRTVYEETMVRGDYGVGTFSWTSRDRFGRHTAPGVYFAQISNVQKSIVAKLVVVQ